MLPTNEIASTSGWVNSAFTASASPCTTVCTPSGKPASLHQLGEQQRRRRILLRRLEHERVAARERVGEHPQRHHHREVERRDAGDDADRLQHRVHVDAARHLGAVRALEQVRDAARELDAVEAAGDLAARVVEHLAVLAGDRGRPARRGARRPARADGTCAALRRLSGESRHSAAAAAATLTAASTSAADANATSAGLHAARRVVDRRRAAPTSPSTRRPPIQCPMVCTWCRPAFRRCVQRR